MTDCRYCRTANAYDTGFTLECTNNSCNHFSQKWKDEIFGLPKEAAVSVYHNIYGHVIYPVGQIYECVVRCETAPLEVKFTDIHPDLEPILGEKRLGSPVVLPRETDLSLGLVGVGKPFSMNIFSPQGIVEVTVEVWSGNYLSRTRDVALLTDVPEGRSAVFRFKEKPDE